MQLHFGTRSEEISLVIFDKDGTLVDLHASWGRWFGDVVQLFSAYIAPQELLQRFGWDASTERIRPETPMAIASVDETRSVFATMLYEAGLGWTAATAVAREAMEAIPPVISPPLCPLLPLFERLNTNAVKIAIITSDNHDGVIRDLESLGLLPYIEMIVGGDSGIPIKPSPDAVHAITIRTGIPAERMIVVGDSLADLAMGRAANVALTIGVLSGSGTHEILAPLADVVIDSVCQLLDG